MDTFAQVAPPNSICITRVILRLTFFTQHSGLFENPKNIVNSANDEVPQLPISNRSPLPHLSQGRSKELIFGIILLSFIH